MGRKLKNNARHVRNSGNPEFLNPEALLVDFAPLMKRIHQLFSQYYPFFNTPQAKEDLYSNIQMEFLILRREYDYTSGIDFEGYIKLTLQNRVYNRHIVPLKRRYQAETLNSEIWNTNQFSADGLEFESDSRSAQDIDEDAEIAFQNVIARESVPWELLDETQRKIVELVLSGESLPEVSRELGMKLKDTEITFEEILETVSNGG